MANWKRKNSEWLFDPGGIGDARRLIIIVKESWDTSQPAVWNMNRFRKHTLHFGLLMILEAMGSQLPGKIATGLADKTIPLATVPGLLALRFG